MKRLFIFASLAIMAVGCQKTFVQDEVQTPIGFSTEVGKQTRAVVTDKNYLTDQPFTVFAYGHQGNTTTTVMNGVEIKYHVADSDNPTKWAADTKYYWPNDSETTMNFYAYSPAGLSLTHTEDGGFTGSYTNEMYKDFMVATPVKGAKYTDQNGSEEEGNPTSVPVKFNHQLTQVVFNVSATIPSVTVTVESITLKQIGSTSTYTQSNNNPWSEVTTPADYTVFGNSVDATTNEVASASTNVVTKPVVMIPQNLTNLKFNIVYKLEGTGVATETVNKEIALATTSLTSWDVNKKVVYNLSVGLHEITFTPEVADWDTPDIETEEIDVNIN